MATSSTLGNSSPDLVSLVGGTAESSPSNPVIIMSPKVPKYGEQAFRFPPPFTVQFNSGPLFPLRNKTNLPTSSPNLLFQSILRDSQQIKAEYEHYKGETRAKLLKQEETIRNLKENLDNSQKKLLEMKLQKEAFVARESHAFQEIYDAIHSLLLKVSSFASAAESLNLEMVPPPEAVSPQVNANTLRSQEKLNCIPPSYDDLAEKLRNLESKMATFEGMSRGVLSTCKATEANLKLYMTSTNEKLDQIMLCIMANKGFSSSRTAAREDADASLYNASAEDNQDSSDGCDLSAATGQVSPSNMKTDGQEAKQKAKDNLVHEDDKVPRAEKSFLSSSNKASQQQVNCRKRKSTNKAPCNNKIGGKPLRRKLCRIKRRRREVVNYYNEGKQEQCDNDDNGDDDEDLEQPPKLSLPCRVAKYSRSRSDSMPILQPEGEYILQHEQKKVEQMEIPVLQQQENRKDDALIGIKRENFSNIVHRKDFSKVGFICLCGAKFTGAGGLYVHQVKTMENEKFSCKSCGKKFHYFSGLKAHRKSAHKQDFTQEVGCSRCGQIFKSKKDRQGHLDERGQTCWLSGSYQSKDWEAIRHKRNLSSSSSYYSSTTSPWSTPSSQNANSQS